MAYSFNGVRAFTYPVISGKVQGLLGISLQWSITLITQKPSGHSMPRTHLCTGLPALEQAYRTPSIRAPARDCQWFCHNPKVTVKIFSILGLVPQCGTTD